MTSYMVSKATRTKRMHTNSNPFSMKPKNMEKKHRAQFEVSKYMLVHFTRNKGMETIASIMINGATVEPSNEAKYLGVIFDQELQFKPHLQHVIKKGTNTAMALSSIAKSTWGTPFTYE